MAAPLGSYDWTPARVAHVTEQWAAGLSAGEIAMQVGVTRSKVMGKIHRLGLPTRKVVTRAPRLPTPRRAKSENGKDGAATQYINKPRSPQSPPVEQPANTIPRKQRKTLMELTETTDPARTTCRYPYGDPQDKGFFFCGAETLPSKPYCSGHYKLAYHRY